MNFRLYSKKNKCYTNDPDFRSFCQDTTSIWTLEPDGKILELIYHPNQEDDLELKTHKSQDFVVEPWTGYFDSNGKKIYCGDILEMRSMFDFKSKVVWKNGAFKLIPIDPEGLEEDMGRFGILKGWAVTSNIHNIEFLE